MQQIVTTGPGRAPERGPPSGVNGWDRNFPSGTNRGNRDIPCGVKRGSCDTCSGVNYGNRDTYRAANCENCAIPSGVNMFYELSLDSCEALRFKRSSKMNLSDRSTEDAALELRRCFTQLTSAQLQAARLRMVSHHSQLVSGGGGDSSSCNREALVHHRRLNNSWRRGLTPSYVCAEVYAEPQSVDANRG